MMLSIYLFYPTNSAKPKDALQWSILKGLPHIHHFHSCSFFSYYCFLFYSVGMHAPELHHCPLGICVSMFVCCGLSDLCLFCYLSTKLVSPLGLIKLSNHINSRGISCIGLTLVLSLEMWRLIL